MPKRSDPREIMANQLLMRGHATMKELLTMSFGEWPPKGLNITPYAVHDQEVEFRPLVAFVRDTEKYQERGFFYHRLAEFKARHTLGRATLDSDRTIWINKLKLCTLPHLFWRQKLVSTLGHEATHILQGDHYYRAADTFGNYWASQIWAGNNDVSSNEIMNPLMVFRKKMLSPAFNEKSQKSDEPKGIDYLIEGIEIQARMHQIIIEGYQDWGRMPQNTAELWAAFVGAGLKAPKNIRQYLKSLPKDTSTSLFNKNKRSASGQIIDINTVLRSMTEPGREKFWTEALPALYSDLIEMYGDIQGRARFNMGVNPKAQMHRNGSRAGQMAPPAHP